MSNKIFCENKKGFVIIEALIVIIILSILVMMATPKLDSTGVRVRTVTRQIMDDMRYARTKAVTDARDVIVDFSVSNQYIVDGVTKLLPNGITCNAMPTSFTFKKFGNAVSGGSLTVLKGKYSESFNIIASTGMVYKSGS